MYAEKDDINVNINCFYTWNEYAAKYSIFQTFYCTALCTVHIWQSTINTDRLHLRKAIVIVRLNNTVVQSASLWNLQLMLRSKVQVRWNLKPLSFLSEILPNLAGSTIMLLSFTEDPHIFVKCDAWICWQPQNEEPNINKTQYRLRFTVNTIQDWNHTLTVGEVVRDNSDLSVDCSPVLIESCSSVTHTHTHTHTHAHAHT